MELGPVYLCELLQLDVEELHSHTVDLSEKHQYLLARVQ